jgi:hypothetical protein
VSKWHSCDIRAGMEWTQFEPDGFWESEAGYVEEGAPGVWFAFPNVNADTRLSLRGPYSSREQAMEVTAEAYRHGYWSGFDT